MDTSIFLAKLIGPIMLMAGIFVVIYPKRINSLGKEFLASGALLFMSSIITLTAGLSIVNSHNIWALNWRGLITAIGWIAVIAGGARMLLPDAMISIGDVMLENRMVITVPGILMALIGVYLSYQGYLG